MNKKAALTVALSVCALVALSIAALMHSNQPAPAQAEQVAAAKAVPAVSTATPEANMTPIPSQVIEITAKHGYSPEMSVVKANTPTILKITTTGYDCSNALVIPDLHYQARLPVGGTTEIQVPPQPAGTELTGLCGMGMYSFKVKFEG